jgi:hypothetical protein
MDNLNIHCRKSLTDFYGQELGYLIWDRFTVHYTPIHGSAASNSRRTFASVPSAELEAGLPVDGTRWGSGCTFLDYDRDGRLDIFVSNYVDLDLGRTPKPGDK